jgi:hypothetical protein
MPEIYWRINIVPHIKINGQVRLRIVLIQKVI